MSDEQTTDPQVQTAADDFDVTNWLSDVINAEGEITVYRNGTLLLELNELSALAAEATEKSDNAQKAELSIADEYTDAATEAREAADQVREALKPSGLTFKLRSIGTESRDVLLKKLERRFPAEPAKDGKPAVKGGTDHPDFYETYQEELLAKTIVSATAADGRTDAKPWTVDRVKALRGLPQFEFQRLWNKASSLYTTQYNIDQMFDLDFSSRH